MRKKPTLTRPHIVKTYLSDDEKTILDLKFKHSGKPGIAAFLRALIIEGKVYDMDYSFMREYNVKLGNISNNINQIARRVNSTSSIYEADINALKKEIENVWLIQKSILSELPLPELSATSLIPKKRTGNS
ncbi:MAG: plasmid mobilization relaxosome protein MobC [Lachnospiraceae bacterium]|nr:plasmid mobilization relaxosome protein MobC [Lachnospiraceae bacterium]